MPRCRCRLNRRRLGFKSLQIVFITTLWWARKTIAIGQLGVSTPQFCAFLLIIVYRFIHWIMKLVRCYAMFTLLLWCSVFPRQMADGPQPSSAQPSQPSPAQPRCCHTARARDWPRALMRKIILIHFCIHSHYEKSCTGMNVFRNGMNSFQNGMNSFRTGMKSFRMDTGIWGRE